MKQTNLLKTFLLLCALVVGSTCAWADITSPWSHTFSTTAKTFTADGTETLSGVDWTLAVTWAGSSKDYNFDSSKGMKIGSNSKVPTSMTLSSSGITGTITKVSVSTCGRSGGSCVVGVKVGTTDFTTTDSWGAATMTKMEFTGEASGAIEISWDQSGAASSKQGAFYVKDITVEFEEAGGGDKETATWTVSPASATVAAGESIVLDLTTNYDGTLNFESGNDEVATVSYNASTKKITINGVAKGATTINVTGAATDTYKSISETIDVTVTRSVPAGQLFYESLSGYTGSSDVSTELATTSAYLDSEDWNSFSKVYAGKVLSGDSDGHLKFGSSSAKGTAVTKSIALTGNGKLTYKVQCYDSKNAGNLKISVTGATATGDVDVTGTAAWVEKTVYLTGAEGNVVITFETTSSNTRIRVDDILLTQVTSEPVAITSATGFATLYTAYPLDFSTLSSELKAYTATVTGNTVTLTQVDNVPANTGIVLKGDVKTHNVPVIASSTTEKGDLTGSVTEDLVYDSEATKDYFYLGINAGKAQFKRLTSGSIGAGKAYLALDKSTTARELDVVFDETTALTLVNSEKRTVNSDIYNLAGQRVAQPTKGLYIVNGKKVVIK